MVSRPGWLWTGTVSVEPIRERVAARQPAEAIAARALAGSVVDLKLDQLGAQPGQQRPLPFQGHDRALADDRDAAQPFGLIEVVGGQDGGHAGAAARPLSRSSSS